MIIKRWKKESGDILIVMEKGEYIALRNRLLSVINSHFPGDGTCNTPAYGVARSICSKTYDDVQASAGILYPGDGRSDSITLHLSSHTYCDFQELLQAWLGDWATGICSVLWGKVMTKDEIPVTWVYY